MSLLLRDIRFALRSFSRRPGFTAVVVSTLALGIGSNVAIFGVANAVLFQPLPYSNPDRLALVWTQITNQPRALVSGPDFNDYRNETTLFEGFAGAFGQTGAITGEGRAEEITVAYSTANMFEILGIGAHVGRVFETADEVPFDVDLFLDPNAELPAGPMILSHGLWQRRFGGDPDIIGRTIQVDGTGSIVVGILPPTFRVYLPEDAGMPSNIDAWGVIPANFNDTGRDAAWLTVVTRLKDGVTPIQAQQEMDALASRLRDQYQHHADGDMHIAVNNMHEDVVAHARPVLLALLGAVGFVLLIACATSRIFCWFARPRGKEKLPYEPRLAAVVGGSSGRMLTESGLLAVAGGVLGVLLAWWGGRLLITLRPDTLPRFEQFAIDGSVLLFTLGATGVAAVIFGLAPALKSVSSNLAVSLRDRGSDSGGVTGNKLRTTLVIAEVALSLVLLVGTGLMFRTFSELQSVAPGFSSDNVLTFGLPVPLFKYRDPERRNDVHVQIQTRIEGLPGVQAVGATSPLPLAGGDQYAIGSYGVSESTEQEWRSNRADYRGILPGFMDAMQINIVAGRGLEKADNRAGALEVAVVDERIAERMWPDGDALGKEILIERFNFETFGLERIPLRVVGLSAPVRSQSLATEGREAIYFPYRFFPWFPLSFTVRTAGDPGGLVESIRREIETVDPDIPLSNVRLMDEYVDDALAQTRFRTHTNRCFCGSGIGACFGRSVRCRRILG